MSFYLCASGLATGLVVIAISGMHLWQKPAFFEGMAWQLGIMLSLFFITRPEDDKQGSIIGISAFYLMPILIFAVSWRVPVDIYFIYTIMWVACVPYYASRAQGWFWLVVINLAWYAIRLTVWNEQNALIETLLVGTFHVFALLSSMTAREAEEANQKTQQLNRELLATQHLLSESSKNNERSRIARDLHDLLGHHLTALTINLQVAGHLTHGEAKEKIDQCHALSKLLLSDVREAVSQLRSMPTVNIAELLEIAVRGIPRLSISLEVDEELQLDDVASAEVLLRTVQEAITNTLKHSHANSAAIKVCVENNQVVLHYTDSGSGCVEIRPGNGLAGMRERVERLGGQLEVRGTPAVSLRLSIPLVT